MKSDGQISYHYDDGLGTKQLKRADDGYLYKGLCIWNMVGVSRAKRADNASLPKSSYFTFQKKTWAALPKEQTEDEGDSGGDGRYVEYPLPTAVE